MEKQLPNGWTSCLINEMLSNNGLFVDGDWVESKDQDENGDVRLTQLADIGDGIWKNRSNRFMTTAKTNELNCTILMKNDILIARMPDPLGRACVFVGDEKPCVTVVDVAIVRTGVNGVIPKWLMFSINSPPIRSKILSLQSGTTRKRISRKNLSTITFPLPPLNEQKRIVAKIEELFSLVDSAKDTLEKTKVLLKQYRQSILKHAFEGKLTEEWRKRQTLTFEPAFDLIERIKIGTEVPLIENLPKKWASTTFGNLFEIKVGSTPSRSKPEYWNGHIPWISSGQVCNCEIFETKEKITEVGFQNSSLKILPAGTILLAMIGEGKTRGQVGILKISATTNQNIASIMCADSEILTKYLYFWLLNRYDESRKIGFGGMQKALNSKIVKTFPLILSPIEEQYEIISKIEESFSLIEKNEILIDKLLLQYSQIKNSILKQAFEGKLVPQDPNDEPAEVLLQRIREEKNGK